MTNQIILSLITIFCIKHFVVDFLLQNKWQYSNKHILGHPGGYFHAWLHAFVTFGILLSFSFPLNTLILFRIAFIELLIHYFVDWAKMNISMHYQWKANTHPQFWFLLGFDQLLHYLTYVGIVYYLTTLIVQ